VTVDMAQFLLARNADDLERAKFVQGQLADPEPEGPEPWRLSWHDEYDLLCVEPTRAIAECGARGDLIEISQRALLSSDSKYAAFARAVLLDLAWPYKSHPDYAEAVASIIISKRPLTEADIRYGQRVAAQLESDRETGREVDPADPWRFTVPEPGESKEQGA
jgi:Family of unknown function (DUF6221)